VPSEDQNERQLSYFSLNPKVEESVFYCEKSLKNLANDYPGLLLFFTRE